MTDHDIAAIMLAIIAIVGVFSYLFWQSRRPQGELWPPRKPPPKKPRNPDDYGPYPHGPWH